MLIRTEQIRSVTGAASKGARSCRARLEAKTSNSNFDSIFKSSGLFAGITLGRFRKPLRRQKRAESQGRDFLCSERAEYSGDSDQEVSCHCLQPQNSSGRSLVPARSHFVRPPRAIAMVECRKKTCCPDFHLNFDDRARRPSSRCRLGNLEPTCPR